MENEELNAIAQAFKCAQESGMPWYAIEGKYEWTHAERKPSLRFGKVWECHPDGKKYHS